MAAEIQWRGTETGVTLYATIRSKTGTQWNTAGTPNFEAVTAANWADYDVALAESSGNYFYVGTFPAVAGNMVVGWYWVDIYKRAGGSPAITDVLQGTVVGYWDGTSLLPWAADIKAVNGTAASASGTVSANVVSMDADVITAAAIAAGALEAAGIATDVVAKLFATHTLAESYAVKGEPATVAQLLYLIQAWLTEKSVTTTVATAKKLDGSTTAGTFMLNSATAPTSVTRAT